MRSWIYWPLLNEMAGGLDSSSRTSLMSWVKSRISAAVALNSRALKNDSGIKSRRLRSSFIWQARRKLSACSSAPRWASSCGVNFSGAPSRTRRRQSPQMPRPPQADGRKIFSSFSACRREMPGLA